MNVISQRSCTESLVLIVWNPRSSCSLEWGSEVGQVYILRKNCRPQFLSASCFRMWLPSVCIHAIVILSVRPSLDTRHWDYLFLNFQFLKLNLSIQLVYLWYFVTMMKNRLRKLVLFLITNTWKCEIPHFIFGNQLYAEAERVWTRLDKAYSQIRSPSGTLSWVEAGFVAT